MKHFRLTFLLLTLPAFVIAQNSNRIFDEDDRPNKEIENPSHPATPSYSCSKIMKFYLVYQQVYY